jgi:hypothetical protein
MRMELFETLGPQTQVCAGKVYQMNTGLMAVFTAQHHKDDETKMGSDDYGFALYDFDDHIFESARHFGSLDDAKSAALAAANFYERKAA